MNGKWISRITFNLLNKETCWNKQDFTVWTRRYLSFICTTVGLIGWGAWWPFTPQPLSTLWAWPSRQVTGSRWCQSESAPARRHKTSLQEQHHFSQMTSHCKEFPQNPVTWTDTKYSIRSLQCNKNFIQLMHIFKAFNCGKLHILCSVTHINRPAVCPLVVGRCIQHNIDASWLETPTLVSTKCSRHLSSEKNRTFLLSGTEQQSTEVTLK